MRLEVFVLALSVLVAPIVSLLGGGVSATGPWVVVIPPWVDAEGLVARANVRLIGPTQAPFGYLVAAEAPGAPVRLADAGAWAVVDAEAVANLCGVN